MIRAKKPARNPFSRVANVQEEAVLIMQGWARDVDKKIIDKQGRKGTAFPKEKPSGK